MGKYKSDNGFLGGILGGLVVSLFNIRANSNNEIYDEWNDFGFFEDFTYSYNRKKEGYKLEYDINDEKVIPKYVNLIRESNRLYTIRIDNKKIKGAIDISPPQTDWEMVELYIKYMFDSAKHNGMIRFINSRPKYWIYTIKSEDEYIIINISDQVPENSEICIDDFICMEINEALELASEMKRYYHNYVRRVVINKDYGGPYDEDNIKPDQSLLMESFPNYSKIIEKINLLNDPIYKELINILKEASFNNVSQMVYTLFSFSILLSTDKFYLEAEYILEYLYQMEEEILINAEIDRDIYRELLDIYIILKREQKIISLIDNIYSRNYDFLSWLGNDLYENKLYDAAMKAYKIAGDNPEQIKFKFNLFNIYLKAENRQGMKNLRDILLRDGKSTRDIDKYLLGNNSEDLLIKISNSEKEKDWDQVIDCCNKYNKLNLNAPSWVTKDNITINEIKKVNAYLQLNKLHEAWIASCKSRRALISNFNKEENLNYISKIEKYMSDICLRQNYFIDSIFHYILSIVYKDVFDYYTKDKINNHIWVTDLYLENLIKDSKLNEWWEKFEPKLGCEYKIFSHLTVNIVYDLITTNLQLYNYKLKMTEPAKYFPNTLPIEFVLNS